jgi:hypothetical protein
MFSFDLVGAQLERLVQRAHVTETRMSSSPRILHVSNIILRSSSVWSSPSAKLPAPPSTLNAIGYGYTFATIGSPSSDARDCASSSSIAFTPVPDTDW